jgi:hypothetical protein
MRGRSSLLLAVMLAIVVLSLVKIGMHFRSGTILSDLIMPLILIAVIAEQLIPKYDARSAMNKVLKSVIWAGCSIAFVLFIVSGIKGH